MTDIIIHAFPAWSGNYVKSTVELARRLPGQGHRVLYVDYAYTLTDFLRSLLGRGYANWRKLLGRSLTAEAEGLYVLSLPPLIPVNFISNPTLHDALVRFNSRLVGEAIRKAVKKLGYKDPVVINAFNPAYGLPLAGKLGESRRIYYCYDEINAAAWAKKQGGRLEKAFIPHCQAVVVTSEGLKQRKSGLGAPVYVVKNGVDFAHYSQPLPKSELPVLPPEFQGRKIIGYIGSVDDRLDLKLLNRLIRRFPEAVFLFVGRISHSYTGAQLGGAANVHLTGPRPYTELPGWIQLMDVCLIPFVKNEFTAGIYPLKINEYLACGKPVVSTCFADLSDFSGIAAIARNAGEFETAVEGYLQNAEAGKAARIAFAEKNSWEQRAAELADLLKG